MLGVRRLLMKNSRRVKDHLLFANVMRKNFKNYRSLIQRLTSLETFIDQARNQHC